MTAKPIRWTPEENHFLMKNAHRIPWSKIATTVGRSEAACKAQFKKIRNLRIANGTWKGI
jgi:DNA-binding Lrp family transcriptional regulator